jgi:hypothetical protein
MLSKPRWSLAVLLAGALLAGPAAADPTEADARAVDTDLRAWLTRQFGTLVDVAALPLRVVAQGDALALDIPFGGVVGQGGASFAPATFKAKLKPLEGGRYAVEDAQLSMPWTAKVASGPKGLPSAMTLNIAEQSVRGIVDPSLATTSTLDTKLRGYDVTVETNGGRQTSHIDGLTSHSVWQPAGGGRVNMTGESVMERYTTADRMPDGKPTLLTVDRIRVTGGVDKVDFDRIGFANRAMLELTGLAGSGPALSDKTPLTARQKATLRTLIGELAAVFEALRSEQVWENARLQIGDQSGSLRRVTMGFSMAAPKGIAEARFPIALEGFDSPQIPPGPMRDVLPRSLSLTPRLSGVSKAALLDMLTRAVDAGPDDFNFDEAADALLEQGKLALGIDDLAIEVGPMKLTGEGEVEVGPAREITGEAELRATGLDALIRRANTTPELKMAAPALIFLKGIGRQDGKDTVWHITYADRELMVNDTNVSDLMPAGK